MHRRSAVSLRVLTRGLLFALPWALMTAPACGGERKSIADQIGPPTKKLSEMKQTSKVSEEELARRRKEAGFVHKSDADAALAAENAKAMEKVEREWIKTRLKDYRALTEDTRKFVDDIDKETAKWAAAKDPQKAADKAAKGLQDRYRELVKTIDKLSERSTKGGNTQASYNKLFRPLEEVVGALGPEIASDAAFTEALKGARGELDTIVAALDDIDKDETLEANKFHDDDDAKKKKK